MNIPIEPWVTTPIIIRHASDYGYALYVGSLRYPLYRETKKMVLRTLRSMLERQVGRKS